MMLVFLFFFIYCRGATTVWHWPLCVDVNEATFEALVTLVDQYWDTVENKFSSPFKNSR